MKKNFALIKKSLSTFAVAIAGVFLMLLAFIGGSFLISRSRGVAKADTSTYWTDYAATKFAGGSGDQNDPYQISNASELAYLAAQANIGNATVSRYYKLTKPIILSSHYWVPIGRDRNENDEVGKTFKFNGVLDCNNQPIIGLNVKGNYEQAGLFGLVDSLIIKNAIISNASINITNDTGSAGIIAGTINNSVGSLQVINSQISGSITSLALPSTKDGIGGIIGSIRGCSSANTNIENVYLTATINAPNRPNNTCMGVVAGSSDVSLALGKNLNNIVTNTSLEGKNGTATNLTYYGDFGGTGVSPWFYYYKTKTGADGEIEVIEALQDGIPQIKSQYYIGANINNTGEEVVRQLVKKKFTYTDLIATFIPEATKYTMTIKTEKSNNTTRSGFTASAQTRTGSPYAVNGERVTLSNTNVTGYQFTGWKLDSKAYDRIGSKDNLITPTTFTGVAADVIKLGRKYMFEDKISIMITAYMDNWSEFKSSSSDMRLISCTEAGGWNFEPIDDGYIQFACYDKGVGYKSVKGSKKWSELSAGWHTFLGVFDGSYAKLYVDGEYLAMSTKFTSGKIGYNSGNGIFVGGEAGSNTSTPAGSYFKGKIGCVLIQNDTKPTNIYYTCAGANETLTARWVPNQYTVTYNPNNGSVSPTTKVVTYDAAYGELATPTKTGYTFSNWAGKNLFNKDATAYSTNNYINESGTIVSNSEYKIYQIYIPANTTITITNSGKSNAPGYAFYTADGTYISAAKYNTTAKITVKTPANAGFMRFSVVYNSTTRKDIDSFQIELGSSATTYDAYKSVTATTVVGYPNDHSLTANWTANTYQVKYNANGGTGTMNNSTHTYDVASSLTANAFTRTGYIFAGWATTSAGSVAYADKASVKNLTSKQGDVYNLYAKWTAIKYQVKYNANGGSGSMTNSEHTYDVGKNLTKNTFTRTGYTFAGWATSSTGAKVYNDEASVTNLSATNGAIVELYAKWTAINYTITLNANGGSGGSLSKTTYNISTSAQTITITKPTRNGYSVSKWTVTGHSGGTASASETTLTIPANTYGNLTVKAEWTPNTIKITLDKNGGSGGTSEFYFKYGIQKYYSNSACTTEISEIIKPSKTGYTFSRYYCENAIYGANAGETYTLLTSSDLYTDIWGDLTLKAEWTANIYKITLDKQSGSGGTTNIWYKYEQTSPNYYYSDETCATGITNSTITIPTRDGYEFRGYYTSQNGGGTQCIGNNGGFITQINNKYKTAANSTLYAYWIPKVYMISLDKQGGTDGTTTAWYKYGVSTFYGDSGCISALTNNVIGVPTRAGYTFNGYFSATGGAGVRYTETNGAAANSIFTTIGNKTLYAYWTPKTYTVTFNATSSGGVASTLSKTVTFDSTYGELPTGTKPCYTLKGWYTAASGGIQITSSTKYTTAGNTTLYAQWNEDPSETFSGTSSVTVKRTSVSGGTKVSGTALMSLKTTSGTSEIVSFDYTYDPSKISNMTIPWTVTFNGESAGSGVEYDSTPTQLISFTTTITSKSYNFYVEYVNNSTTSGTLTILVRSKNTPFTYVVSFTYIGNLSGDSSKVVTYGSTYGTLPTVTRTATSTTKYTFKGWYTSVKDGEGTRVTSSTKVTTASDHKLYAQWTTTSITCCLEAGTQITMADGTFKNIEDIRTGDLVMTYNLETGELEASKVVDRSIVTRVETFTITFNDGTFVKITSDHPMLSKRGWVSLDPYLSENGSYTGVVKEGYVTKVGDIILSGDGLFEKEIVSIERNYYEDGVYAYTFSTEINHNYFANGSLVHNKVVIPTDPCQIIMD